MNHHPKIRESRKQACVILRAEGDATIERVNDILHSMELPSISKASFGQLRRHVFDEKENGEEAQGEGSSNGEHAGDYPLGKPEDDADVTMDKLEGFLKFSAVVAAIGGTRKARKFLALLDLLRDVE